MAANLTEKIALPDVSAFRFLPQAPIHQKTQSPHSMSARARREHVQITLDPVNDELRLCRAEQWPELLIRRISLIITLTAKATAATPLTTAAPMGAAGESRARWPGLIHREGPPLQGLSVKSLDRPLHVFLIRQFDEAKPSRFARHLVANDRGRNNLKPSVDYKLAKHTIGDTAGKVPHE
jgi:hypothetical protein